MEEKTIKKVVATEIHGRILNCTKLRIREIPSLEGTILGILEEDSDFVINKKESTPEFWKIEFDGISGYCLKTFVKTNIVKIKSEEVED